jgi:hypothetical protein
MEFYTCYICVSRFCSQTALSSHMYDHSGVKYIPIDEGFKLTEIERAVDEAWEKFVP